MATASPPWMPGSTVVGSNTPTTPKPDATSAASPLATTRGHQALIACGIIVHPSYRSESEAYLNSIIDRMKSSPPRLADSVTFQLGTLGILALARLAPRLELHDLKPKHLGMLALLDSVEAGSQLEVARAMNIAPSLVVALADH